jgi:putative two-component system response regulator
MLAAGTSDLVRAAQDIAYCHHERWDGSGYPRGLAGADIPLVARIVAIADVFDALSHDRPYRRALPADEVLWRLELESGTHFDPGLITALRAADWQPLTEGDGNRAPLLS